MLKVLQQLVCFCFQHISLIHSGSCDHFRSVTREQISILRTRLLIVRNTKRCSWTMWRMNTVLNIDHGPSLNPKMHQSAISSTLERLLDLVYHLLVDVICPVMMNCTSRLNLWQKGHHDGAITQHAYWQPQSSIWICRLEHQWTGGKLIQILMITTPNPRRVAVYFGYRISLTGGLKNWKCTQSTPISAMWHATYSLSYHHLMEWSPVFPFCERLWAGGCQKQQATAFAWMSY